MPAVRIQLIRLDDALERALAADSDYRDALARDDWPLLAKAMLRHVAPIASAAPATAGPAHWFGYCAVDAASHEVIGTCAFKGPPNAAGTVEIAYFTYPGFEGRGYATQMAHSLVDLARGAPDVRHIIAHTLPEPNASTRVLTKIGMTMVGEVDDPQDGRVWRWELRGKEA